MPNVVAATELIIRLYGITLFSVHGDFKESMSTLPFNNKLWLQFLQLSGKIGVDVFVIISGYFLISSKKIKLVKVLKFWSQSILK